MNDFTPTDYGVEAPALFSVEEFQQLVDTSIFEGSRVELAEGVIVRMSPAMPRHVRIQRNLFVDLNTIFGQGIDGYLAAFEMTIRFGARTLRDLDVAIVTGLAEAETYLGPDAVLLAVEVSATTLHYDLNEKRIEYARGAIPHYWVIDVAAESVHIFGDPIDGDYTARRRAAFGEPLAVPGITATVIIR